MDYEDWLKPQCLSVKLHRRIYASGHSSAIRKDISLQSLFFAKISSTLIIESNLDFISSQIFVNLLVHDYRSIFRMLGARRK